jgi:vacuolar protein sorting-associated protein 52
MQKIYQFRKPMANYQITQDILLRSRFFYEFLTMHDRAVARECRDEYINTLSKVYYSYFKEYSSKLSKLQLDEVADKEDLLGSEDKPKTSLFSSKPTMRNRSTVFTLGNRFAVIETEIEASIIIPHASQKSDLKYSLESIFRSEQFALLDNSCNEYLFLCDFFLAKDKAASEIFAAVLGKTFSLFVKNVENLIQSSYDAIGIFLCIYIIQRYEILAKQRNCLSILSYYDNIMEILWQRFDFVMQLHTNSVSNIDTHKLQSLDVRPHYITRRYAEFSTSLYSINEHLPNPKLNAILSQLQVEVQNFILRLASEFTQRKEQLISVINNYDLMLSVIVERIKEDNNREAQNLKELLNNRINDYVEEVLMPYFGNLICFVKECEIIIEKENFTALKSYETHVNPLIKNFLNDWKKSLDLINQEIMRSFTNFKNGQSILQASLTQLIQYYHRFHKVMSHNAFKHLPIRNEMLSIHHLMVEIKKHKPTF